MPPGCCSERPPAHGCHGVWDTSGWPRAVASYHSLGAEDDADSRADDRGKPAEYPGEVGEAADQTGVVFPGGGLTVAQHHEGANADDEQDGCYDQPPVPAGGVSRLRTGGLKVRLLGGAKKPQVPGPQATDHNQRRNGSHEGTQDRYEDADHDHPRSRNHASLQEGEATQEALIC